MHKEGSGSANNGLWLNCHPDAGENCKLNISHFRAAEWNQKLWNDLGMNLKHYKRALKGAGMNDFVVISVFI